MLVVVAYSLRWRSWRCGGVVEVYSRDKPRVENKTRLAEDDKHLWRSTPLHLRWCSRRCQAMWV